MSRLLIVHPFTLIEILDVLVRNLYCIQMLGILWTDLSVNSLKETEHTKTRDSRVLKLQQNNT